MSDTTPTPRSDEPTPLADETAKELGTGEQPITTSSDPADHTDTAAAPTLPPGYDPVVAANHVAPGPSVATVAQQDAGADASPAAPATPDRPLADAPAHPEQAALADSPVPSAEHPQVDSPAQPASGDQPPATAVPAPAQAGYAGPTYLPPPTPPQKRGNRGLGILIAILGAVIFAAADLAATYGILLLRYGSGRAETFLTSYVQNWEFWVPLAVFLAAFIALVAIVNRGRWWGYVLGSVFVAIFVFAAYYGASLLTNRIWERTPAEFRTFTRDYFQSNIPYLWVATVVTFIALEVVIWLGAWIAFHGQQAKRRNVEARAAYEADLEKSVSTY